jgi:hypothetical protein
VQAAGTYHPKTWSVGLRGITKSCQRGIRLKLMPDRRPKSRKSFVMTPTVSEIGARTTLPAGVQSWEVAIANCSVSAHLRKTRMLPAIRMLESEADKEREEADAGAKALFGARI